jgi:hypothetical protein
MGLARLESTMHALVLAALLGASEISQSTEEPTPRVFVDVHPISLTGAPLLGLALGTFVIVPVSATFAVTDRTAVTFDLAVSYLKRGWAAEGWTFTASLGPTFYFGSDQALSGWFITPKASFHVGQAAEEPIVFLGGGNGPVDLGPRTGTAYLAGFDFGYQWRRGSVHVALVSGLSCGYGYRTQPVITPYWVETFPGSRSSWQGFVASANFDLLRLGVAF